MKPLFASLFLLAATALLPVTTARAQSGALLKTFNLKAGQLLLDPARPRLYATLPASNGLAVIDTNTNEVLTTIFVGANPVALAVSRDGTRLYVANGGSTNTAIGVVDLATLQALPSLAAPFTPAAVAAGLDNRLYVLSSDPTLEGLAQIDVSTGVAQTTRYLPGVVFGQGFLQISPDGKTLFYGNTGVTPSTLAAIDVSTATLGLRQVADRSSNGDNGQGLAISHDGSYLVFPNADFPTTLFRTSDLTSTAGKLGYKAFQRLAVFSADDALVYQVVASGGVQGQDALRVFSTKTLAELNFFSQPRAGETAGPSGEISSLAVNPVDGNLYVASGNLRTNGSGFYLVPGDLELVSTQRVSFFDGSVALSNEFFYLKLPDGVPFGYYSLFYSPYLYHNDLGFEYPFDAADGQGGIYLYDFKSSTFWYTNSGLFPYLYDFTLNAWLYYYPDPNRPDYYNTNGVRYFYNFAAGKIISK